MHTLPRPVTAADALTPVASYLVRYRIALYLALLLLASFLIGVEHRALAPQDSAGVRPAARAATDTPDDRPLLTPDR